MENSERLPASAPFSAVYSDFRSISASSILDIDHNRSCRTAHLQVVLPIWSALPAPMSASQLDVGTADCTIAIDNPSQEYQSPTPANGNVQSPGTAGDALLLVSNFIHARTPFFLVCSYFVFSTAIYMVCSDALVGIFWFIYMATNFYIAGSTVIEAAFSIQPQADARQAVQDVEAKGWIFPTPDDALDTLDIVIVAYLPNERDIILGRVRYFLNELAYPRDKFHINAVYNTPSPIEPLESDLMQLTKEYRNLRVIKVPYSTSKAENLNYFFSLNTGADFIAIYDCERMLPTADALPC
jgi:hypothetical protein